MSDRSAACIEIGGTLKRSMCTDLAMAVLDNCAGPEWTERFEDERDVISYIETAAREQCPLALYSDSAAGGMFDTIETTCRALGLAYRRADDGYYAYPPMHAAWFPGMEDPIDNGGAIEQGPMIGIAELRRFHEAGKTLADVLVDYDAALRPIPPLSIEVEEIEA